MSVLYKNGQLRMEGVALKDIARKYGTPVYCYSAARLEENFAAYRDALGRVTDGKNFTICYAVKSNSNMAVLKLLQSCGAGADVVSGGELQRALKAGIAPHKIVYSGVGKTRAELEKAIARGLLQINVESEPELELISEIARRLKKNVGVAIRVNPDVDARTHRHLTTGKKENKFGISIARAPALYDRARKLPGIVPCGVAVHIGSQLVSLAPYKKAYLRVAQLVKTLRARGHVITTVDLGGGIGIRYKDETPPDLNLYALMIRDIILPLGVHVVLEPGRSVSGDAGLLLSQVVSIKRGDNKNFLIIDAAMNDLIRPALYDAWHAVLPCGKGGGKKETYDVVGPVCESGDIFLSNERLPALKPGDLVAVMTSGAYGAVMSSNYNTRPLVPEVLVSGKKYALVRKMQTVEDLIAQDEVPAWLA